MSVETQHPEYIAMLPEVRLVNACAAGQRAVKLLGTDVLPAPGADAQGNYDKPRYDAYLKRAIWANYVGTTKKGLAGAAFRKAITIELPPELEYLNEDADGCGQSISQLAKMVLGDILCDGRQVLLVDHPESTEGLTKAQTKALGLRASIKVYGFTNFINWDSVMAGGDCVLSLAVLTETYNDRDGDAFDEFSHNIKLQHRVLRLTDKVYSQQLYRDNTAKGEAIDVRDAKGATLDYIPAFVIGAQNNDLTVDEIPLADITHVNVGHFRNSADLEENSHIHGQLTLGIASSMTNDQFREANPNGVNVGSMAGHFLGEGGSFTSVQAAPTQLTDELMKRKEDQMVALGAKIVEQGGSTQTATEVRIDAAGQSSTLSDIIDNIEEGFRISIERVGRMMGVDVVGADAFTMNREFFDETMTADDIRASVESWQAGVISKPVLDAKLVKGGLIGDSVDLVKMNQQASEEPGLNLDGENNNDM